MLQATATAEIIKEKHEGAEDPRGPVELWAQNPIFSAAGGLACQRLAEAFPPMSHKKGTMLAAHGEHAGLLVLLKGTARVYVHVPDGREATIRLVSAPMVLGDLELLHGIALLSSVIAEDDVLVATIPQHEYLAFLGRHPEAMLAHLRHLAAASCVTIRNERQVFALLEQRVANLLLTYAEVLGDERGDRVLTPPISLAEIARSLGTIRRSAAKVIAALTKKGVVARHGERFVLLRRDRLEDLAAPIRYGLFYTIGMSLEHLQHEDALPEAEVEVMAGLGSLAGRRATVDSELMVGRSPSCQLVLPAAEVSDRHCRIFRAVNSWRFWVEDLGSVNGTYVNGTPVRRSVLHGGEVIQVGEVMLRFRTAGDR